MYQQNNISSPLPSRIIPENTFPNTNNIPRISHPSTNSIPVTSHPYHPSHHNHNNIRPYHIPSFHNYNINSINHNNTGNRGHNNPRGHQPNHSRGGYIRGGYTRGGYNNHHNQGGYGYGGNHNKHTSSNTDDENGNHSHTDNNNINQGHHKIDQPNSKGKTRTSYDEKTYRDREEGYRQEIARQRGIIEAMTKEKDHITGTGKTNPPSTSTDKNGNSPQNNPKHK